MRRSIPLFFHSSQIQLLLNTSTHISLSSYHSLWGKSTVIASMVVKSLYHRKTPSRRDCCSDDRTLLKSFTKDVSFVIVFGSTFVFVFLKIKVFSNFLKTYFTFYPSFGITVSMAAKLASFPLGNTIVILSPISPLKCVTAAVRTL